MKKVYVAASFAYKDKEKTEERKKQIEEVVKQIKQIVGRNFGWYLPHQLKIENAWDISLDEWSQKVFEHDINALENADLVLFISYGKENNAGSVWEVGYAFAKNIKTIVIKMNDDVESLMITQSVHAIMKREEISSYDWKLLPPFRTGLNDIS